MKGIGTLGLGEYETLRRKRLRTTLGAQLWGRSLEDVYLSCNISVRRHQNRSGYVESKVTE